MPREPRVRQLPSRKCGCQRCLETYPGNRPKTKNCTASWQARWYDDAGNRKSLTRKRKDDAVAAMNRALGEAAAGISKDPNRGKITLTRWHDEEWLETRASKEAATIAKNSSHWTTHVQPRWGKMTLRSIEHKDVQKWVTGLEATGLGYWTVSGAFNLLDQLLAFAQRDKRIDVNPCDGVRLRPPAKKHAADSRPPTVEQVQAASEQIGNEIYRQVPLLVLETGLRWGEVAGLPPENVDLEAGLLYVKQILEEIGGKKVLRSYPKSDAGFRTLPLTTAACTLIRIQYALDEQCNGEPIFRGPNGGWLSRNAFRTRIWLPAARRAHIYRSVKLTSGKTEHWPTMHDIRHTYGSRLSDGGVPQPTIKEMLGHERPKDDVTWLYTHSAADTKALVLRALGDEPETPIAGPAKLRLVA